MPMGMRIPATRKAFMTNFWASYFDAVRLGLQAQQVIALRMLRISEGGPSALIEMQRMVGEKVLAAWASQTVTGLALARGDKSPGRKAAAPYRKAVRANRRRLQRKGRK